MLVTLAYPWEGHDPDETVDVADDVGRTLLRDGFARAADPGEKTVAELRAYAAEHGIDLAGATRKDDIVAAISAAENPTSEEA